MSRRIRKAGAEQRAGMTRPEVLILLGLLLIVFSTAGSIAWALQRRAILNSVRADLFTIIRAATQYFEDYEHWPTAHTGEYGDFRYGREVSNNQVFNILRAEDGQGDEGYTMNPRRVRYIDIRPAAKRRSGLNEYGEFVDPWGTPYQIVLDTDLNNTCVFDRSRYEPAIGQGIAVWSCGPDKTSDTDDDLLSWKRSP